MRLLLPFFCVLLLAACSKENGPQRLDFVGTSRYTSSNRGSLAPADTLASRIYAEGPGNTLGRLRVTVRYAPGRNPFVYPNPPVRDSIKTAPDPDFVYLDTTLIDPVTKGNLSNFVYTNVFGVRTTTGTERWQYDLYDKAGALVASRAVRLSMRRPDSTSVLYQDYTLKLQVPATGVAARRFLQLRAGLALPAYTVLGLTTSLTTAQRDSLQQLTDLIILPDGLTLAAPNAPGLKLDAQRWPLANRRATLIYPVLSLTATTFTGVITNVNEAILGYYTASASLGNGGSIVGPVGAGQVYAFQTGDKKPRYGLILVVSVPSSTAASVTAGLQLQVRMAK